MDDPTLPLARRSMLGAAAGLTAALAAPAPTRAQGAGGARAGGGGAASGDAKPTPPSSAEQASAAGPVDPVRPLQGKVALVTGGARGIGRASALELARLGADVAVLDIAQPAALAGVADYPLASRGDLDEAERQVRALGVRAVAVVADVRQPAELERAVQQAVAGLGGLDILVAAAGVNLADDTLASHTPAKWSAIVETNVHGVLHAVHAALPALRRRPGARVIVVSSLAGRRGSPKSLVYTTSKWAVTGLMKCLAAELADDGIAVNAVAPSGVDTVLYEKGRPIETVKRDAAEGTVMPVSALAPVDIARAVAFLAGPGGRWMSGSTIDVNAGRSAMLG